jgi:hypothetical protein
MAIDRVAPDFFTGVEVENSPAKGLRTLFVVGIQPVDTIVGYVLESQSYEDTSKHIRHVYFGANMSLHGVANNDHDSWKQWDDMIDGVLSSMAVDYATVDFTTEQVEGFLESLVCDDSRVIPMISVKLPYTKLLNYNTTIKIDDKGFNQTNPGVWCHSLHKLMDRVAFTPWSAYQGDNPVNQEETK